MSQTRILDEQNNLDARRGPRITRASTPGSIDSTCVEEDISTRISESYTLFSETISDLTDDSDGEEEKVMRMRRRSPIIKWNATCLQAFLYPLALAIYLLAGALIFMAIESEHENDVKEISDMRRRILFDEIINNSNLSREQVEQIFVNFTRMCENKVLQNSTTNNWDFLPSVMFVTSVITTIGYGTQSPGTQRGRVFLCFYALLGIPLFLVYMATLGKCLLGIWNAMVLRIPSKRVSMSKRIENYSVVILVIIAFVLVVFLPAALFQRSERQWSYSDAVYFSIVSLTTVGFGDYAPASHHLQRLNYVALYVTWLFIGLAIISVIVAKMSQVYTKVEGFAISRSKKYVKKLLIMKNRHQNAAAEDDNVELTQDMYSSTTM